MGFFSKLFSMVVPNKFDSSKLKANRNHVLCACYSVKGKNPDSHRMKKETVVVESTASMEDVQRKSGLFPPYEIIKVDLESPTEKQISYAKECGITFPEDASVRDASIFLERFENDQPLVQPAIPDDLVRYLIGKNIFVYSYAGIIEASNLYLNGVPISEKAAFFCMRVFCSCKQRLYCLLEDAPYQERNLFEKFGETQIGNPVFLRSLDHYSAVDLPLDSCPSIKKLKAYEIAHDFLKCEGAL